MEESNFERALRIESEIYNSISEKEIEEVKRLSSNNCKTEFSLRSLLRYCSHKTSICSRHCYACRGPMSWKSSIKDTVRKVRWIEKHGSLESALRLSTEIPYRGIFRFLDRGDLSPILISLVNFLVPLRKDVNFTIISRNLQGLNEIENFPNLGKNLSLDSESLCTVKLWEIKPGIKLNYLLQDNEPIPNFPISCIFPVNGNMGKTGSKKKLPGYVRESPLLCSFYKNSLTHCRACLRCFGRIG